MNGDSKELYELIRADITRVETKLDVLSTSFNVVTISNVQRIAALETKDAGRDKTTAWIVGGLIAIIVGVTVNALRIWFF